MRRSLLVIMLTITAASYSAAQQSKSAFLWTLNDVVEQCKELELPAGMDIHEVGVCFGFITGIVQANTASEERFGKRMFCLPEAVGPEQARKVLVKYAADNPNQLHMPAGSIAVTAFSKAFPCKEARP